LAFTASSVERFVSLGFVMPGSSPAATVLLAET
jgi:hypothetical protein